jgi:hypothetical protein
VSSRSFAIESELGRIRMDKCPELTSLLKPKERLRSFSYVRMAVMLCGCLSYRRAADMMNTVLHRAADDAIKVRTLADFIEDYGNGIGSHMKTLAANILNANRFDAETLAPEDAAAFKASIAGQAREAGQAEAEMAEVYEKVWEINSQREVRAQIKRNELVSAVELPSTRCCYISIDDIGVKHQKETRKDGGSKTGRYVENTVIHVQVDGLCHHLTAVGMRNAFAVLMAFLLNNHLMENRRLVFLADGARDILNHIETLFPFCEHSLILDWYHLKKKCKELISSSVKGKKEEKQVIIQDLLRMLWVGNVDEAVEYLNSLEQKSIKSGYWLRELTGYLERKRPQIACYALRDSLGLRNSSNRVEKDNDLLVAQRQKHNGMSWSREGSGALAAINMVLLNKEAEQWLYTRTLPFSMFSDVAA